MRRLSIVRILNSWSMFDGAKERSTATSPKFLPSIIHFQTSNSPCFLVLLKILPYLPP